MREETKNKIIAKIKDKLDVGVEFKDQKIVLDRDYNLQSGRVFFELKKGESVFLAVLVNNPALFRSIHMLVFNDAIYDERFFEVLFALPNQQAKYTIIQYLISITTPEDFKQSVDGFGKDIGEENVNLIEQIVEEMSHSTEQSSYRSGADSPAIEASLFNRVKNTMSPGNSPNISAHSTPSRPLKAKDNDQNKKSTELKGLPKINLNMLDDNVHRPQQQEPFMNNIYLGLGFSSSVAVLGIIIYFILKPSGVNAISDQNDDISCDGLDDHRWYNNMY